MKINKFIDFIKEASVYNVIEEITEDEYLGGTVGGIGLPWDSSFDDEIISGVNDGCDIYRRLTDIERGNGNDVTIEVSSTATRTRGDYITIMTCNDNYLFIDYTYHIIAPGYTWSVKYFRRDIGFGFGDFQLDMAFMRKCIEDDAEHQLDSFNQEHGGVNESIDGVNELGYEKISSIEFGNFYQEFSTITPNREVAISEIEHYMGEVLGRDPRYEDDAGQDYGSGSQYLIFNHADWFFLYFHDNDYHLYMEVNVGSPDENQDHSKNFFFRIDIGLGYDNLKPVLELIIEYVEFKKI